MRVAIIGAGIAGLACAHELERHGIYPDIFEERSRCGELFSHVAGLMQLMNRPVRDQLKWLKNEYNLNLKPLTKWYTTTMHSNKVTRMVKSKHFGYFFERGQGEFSLETQLFNSIKSPINFNCRANYSELVQEYDYVVIANGSKDVAATLGIWKDIFTTMVRGAIVLGDFDPHELIMWVNNDYALGAYAYLTPFNKNRASLTLIHANASIEEMERHWITFLKRENLTYQIVEDFLLAHVAGTVYPHQVGNLLLVGIAGGFMESFLGFGAISSLRSGIFAGQALAKNIPFAKLVKNLDLEMQRSVRLREILNTMRNEDYDHLIASATLPGLSQLIYNTNIPVFQYTGSFFELIRGAVDWSKKSILPPKKK
ncbi:NAD(P)-binding protein [Desulforamulus aeronauticus]|uniref:Dehydrogenase (Flavoprotein) n=1 Tax=Desulforamulus aeronauticus DSM 10349 TaxID=1121421 RepID=A0A1M6TW27_9FIRM|nr:NAD(P)-binding protein [Desulforamulus aeronauticus]SHK61245.1 Dehydrogenase (flavoprotein) [Desulforamulus aeronauticus DSM 10349]